MFSIPIATAHLFEPFCGKQLGIHYMRLLNLKGKSFHQTQY